MIREMIALSKSTYGGCVGLQVEGDGDDDGDGALAAWACRYSDGAIGMLWTEPQHRRRG